MKVETVFYFDVLGFSQMAKGDATKAVDALTDLSTLLWEPTISHIMKPWSHRYALSDSVFLIDNDPIVALENARHLVFNLVNFNSKQDHPVLVRGALAFGGVKHLKGIFLTKEAANVVGPAVVRAVELEKSLKGPRIFLAEDLARRIEEASPKLFQWLLRPTEASGVWEVLWVLPMTPEGFGAESTYIADICDCALRLLQAHGGHPEYGAHYREFVLLCARSIERARPLVTWEVDIVPARGYLPTDRVRQVCEGVSGLPDAFVSHLLALVAGTRP